MRGAAKVVGCLMLKILGSGMNSSCLHKLHHSVVAELLTILFNIHLLFW